MRAREFIQQNTELTDEGLAHWAAAGALGLGATMGMSKLDPYLPNLPTKASIQAPTAKPSTQPIKALTAKLLTQTLQPISNNPKTENLLLKAATQAGIKGQELAQFMAQTRHESWNFTRTQERPKSPNYFTKKYDKTKNPRKAKILGNTKPGDDAKYHGRGYIQLTGRDNYRQAQQALDLPLVNQPELAADPQIAAKIAVWYWQNRVQPHVKDWTDTAQVTAKINPALHGVVQRARWFQDYAKQLA